MTEAVDNTPIHITPKALYDMTADEVETLVNNIRRRRMVAVHHYEAAQKAAQEASDDKARAAIMKQCEMLETNFARIDKALDVMDTRVNKIRVLRLELGLD